MIEPAAVALYAVDRGGVQAGSTVLICGAGPIGALTILCAHAAGAAKIFVSEPNAARRKAIESFGICAGIFDPTKADVVALVKEQTEDHVGVDVAIECVGNENALNTCIEAVRRRGVVVQAGLHVAQGGDRPHDLGAQGHHHRSDLVLPDHDVAASSSRWSRRASSRSARSSTAAFGPRTWSQRASTSSPARTTTS